MVNWFYSCGAIPRRWHLNNRIQRRNRRPRPITALGTAAWTWLASLASLPVLPPTVPSVATSLPLSCRILPLLPPITPNVKFPRAAKPLEFGIWEQITPGTKWKNGKNGNVDPASQHCRMRSIHDPKRSFAFVPHLSPRRRTSRPRAIQARLHPLARASSRPPAIRMASYGFIFASPPRKRKVALP